jgi:hypothetical protein
MACVQGLPAHVLVPEQSNRIRPSHDKDWREARLSYLFLPQTQTCRGRWLRKQ